MEELVVAADEASPLVSASYSDAAITRDDSMLRLEKFATEAKALTAERLSLGTRTADKKRRMEIDEALQILRVRRFTVWTVGFTGCVTERVIHASGRRIVLFLLMRVGILVFLCALTGML